MIGKEIADALAPFVKWGALVLLVLLILGLAYWRTRVSAKKAEQLRNVSEGQKEERDARNSIQDKVAAMRERLRARRRRRMSHH